MKALHITYNGKVIGHIHQGVILSGNTVVETPLRDRLFASLGSLDDVHLIKTDDSRAFTIQISNPLNRSYKPFFFNRQSEYGRNHSYWESLCHSKDPQVLNTSTARYTGRNRSAIETAVIPCTHEISAFIDAMRELNREFLLRLKETILNRATLYKQDKKNCTITDELAERWIDGAFCNVAIQYHFNKASLSVADTMHVDHINSALHMGVTLNGRRKVGFAKDTDDFHEMDMNIGDIYLTTPAAIYHGIGVPTLKEEERSVSLQLRSYLSVDDANEWARNDVNRNVLFLSTTEALEKYGDGFRIPTFTEWEGFYNKRVENLGDGLPNVEYVNIFKE